MTGTDSGRWSYLADHTTDADRELADTIAREDQP